jgi:class 3 adenylate cyclase
MNLDEIRHEFFRFAPSYAIEEAEEALEKILELQSQGLVRNGHFVTGAFAAINAIELTNTAIFIKELGDAVLLIFQCFVDVLRWHSSFEDWLPLFKNDDPKHRIGVRTAIHVGDIILHGINPISLAVSQLFKMEKKVGEGEIVLTEPAYSAAWPTLARAYHAFDALGPVEVEGYPRPIGLFRLAREGRRAVDFVEEAHD